MRTHDPKENPHRPEDSTSERTRAVVTPSARKSTPLDEARIAVIGADVRSYVGFIVNNERYYLYRKCAFSRQQVDRALNALASRGEIVMEPTLGGVRVLLAEPGK